MYSRLLTTILAISIIIGFADLGLNSAQASEDSAASLSAWEEQIRGISSALKRTKTSQKQADILKSFRSKIITEINDTKDLDSPVFERKVSVFNRMNALFLDNFRKENCSSLSSRWNLLYSGEETFKFEAEQIQTWVATICPQRS